MMMQFLQDFREFFEYRKQKKREMVKEVVIGTSSPRVTKPAQQLARSQDGSITTISILNALNGRILEIGTYKPNPVGPDWTYEHFIVQDGESIETALMAILLTKGMK